MTKQTKNKATKFSEDHQEIMKTSDHTTLVDVQWSEEGDFFQKFSLYENYTPVRTSGNTTLLSDL